MTSNAQKAATLLQNLPDMEAMRLRSQLTQQEQECLLHAMATASTLNDEQQVEVFEEFLALTTNAASTPQLETPSTDLPLTPADQLPTKAVSSADLLFEFFHELPATTMFSLIHQESVQTIAVILSHLPTRQSIAILDRFSPELQDNVVSQISSLQHVDLQTLVQIAEVLQDRLEHLQNHSSLLAEM